MNERQLAKELIGLAKEVSALRPGRLFNIIEKLDELADILEASNKDEWTSSEKQEVAIFVKQHILKELKKLGIKV